MAPIMLPIEIISHLSRVLSLSLRLFGNIFGEEMVVLIIASIIPFLAPLPMSLLGVITGTLQAFIFMLLTMIYLAGPCTWITATRSTRTRRRTTRRTRTPRRSASGPPTRWLRHFALLTIRGGTGREETRSDTRSRRGRRGAAHLRAGRRRQRDANSELVKWSIITAGFALAWLPPFGAAWTVEGSTRPPRRHRPEPGAAGDIRGALILGLVLIESLVIYVLLISLILFFVKPFGG